jgi:sigma-54 dependent transcriptional regulator, flagellar regulatory protein
VALRRLLVSPALGWSGNVRQLERVVSRARERALVRDPQATELVPEHLEARDLDGVEPLSATAREGSGSTTVEEIMPASAWQRLQAERARIDEGEIDVIRSALTRNGGVVAHAARELGIARTTLSSRIDALGLKRRTEAQ